MQAFGMSDIGLSTMGIEKECLVDSIQLAPTPLEQPKGTKTHTHQKRDDKSLASLEAQHPLQCPASVTYKYPIAIEHLLLQHFIILLLKRAAENTSWSRQTRRLGIKDLSLQNTLSKLDSGQRTMQKGSRKV